MNGTQFDRLCEAAYNQALFNIASGETRDETRGILLDLFPYLKPAAIVDEMSDALRDALKQGIEREDIDDSWFPA